MRDVRVLELGGSVAAAYCGRLLAASGADVVLVESPAGAPIRRRQPMVVDASGVARSAFHEYLDSGKRSVVLDLEGDHGDRALRWADVVILSVDGDPHHATALRERLARVSPRTVLVALSGFGLTGPYAGWHASDLVDWASGGYLYVSGDPHRAPLQGAGPWASMVTGATAAVGAAVALFDAARSGIGQLVDVGNMEAVASAHQWSLTMYTHTGVTKQRAGLRFENYHPISIYECRDGWLMIAAPTAEQFEQLGIVCEAWELLVDESLTAPSARFERADEVDAHISPWLRRHTVDEVIAALQERRVPAARLNTFHDVLESPQLAARDVWAPRPDIGPSARVLRQPYLVDPAPDTEVGAPPAALGADTAGFLAQISAAEHEHRALPSLDLSTVRVAEFSIAWAGPLAGRFLADFGLDVVKVEHPASRGIPSEARSRHIGAPGWTWGTPADPQIRAEIFPGADPGERFWNRSGIWNKMNRGKRSLALEAKDPDGADVLERLLRDVDVVLHNFSPRGAASLGIDRSRISALSPTTITVAMTGYGLTGPMAPHFSLGPILEAYGGLDHAMGYAGGGPSRLGIAYPDAVGGIHGAYATLAALWQRAVTGAAVHVDVSQLETLVSVVGEAVLDASVTPDAPARRGNRSLDAAPQGVYQCAGDDRWLALTVTDDERWRRLIDIVGDPGLAALREATLPARIERHDDIDRAIERWALGRDVRAATVMLQDAGIAAFPAVSTADLVDDEHLRERGFLVTWDQVDVGPMTWPGYPIHFERRRYAVAGAPGLGADNGDILEALGFGPDEVAKLEAGGVVAERPPG
jgi:crotonobetainyl-CoA:carnitine CoA-transferase CaiB-like acyl-CoA transferase